MAGIWGSLEALEWENRFFGINSSRVFFSDRDGPLTEDELDRWSLVQAKIPASRTDLLDDLQASGFQFVEGEIDFLLPVSCPEPGVSFDVAGPQDIDALREQAAGVFRQSRFRTPWYQPHDGGRFYAQWVENAVRGTFDNQCLLLREGGEIRGFVTLRQLSDEEARVGLLAGKGVGQALIAVARQWCQQRGVKRLRIATQVGNSAALRLYMQPGATIESTAFWLYR